MLSFMSNYTETLEKARGKKGQSANAEIIRALLGKLASSTNKAIKEHVNRSKLTRRGLQGV